MATFGWSADYVRMGINGAQGWVYYSWAMEAEANAWGPTRERLTDGYVRQQTKKYLKQWQMAEKSKLS